MKEKPILFTGPMVVPILKDMKTQTRRLSGLEYVNSYPGLLSGDSPLGPLGYRGLEITDYHLKPSMKALFKKEPGLFHWFLGMSFDGREINLIPVKCPYGHPGDQLWVKETWAKTGLDLVTYRADYTTKQTSENHEWDHTKWRPSIYMPRWASRITLEITGVRVERVQDISQNDAKTEGVIPLTLADGDWVPTSGRDYCGAYRKLWNHLDDKLGYSWASNPWVWVIEFKRLRGLS